MSVTIFDLAPDTIESIDLVVHGASVAAKLGENAYYFTAPVSATSITGIVAHFADGGSKTIGLDLCPAGAIGC